VGDETKHNFRILHEYHVSYFIFFIAISLSHALYFHIGETEKKCFIEEIPDETMVVGACFNEKFVVVAVCCDDGHCLHWLQVQTMPP
jgi:hypothetical protein